MNYIQFTQNQKEILFDLFNLLNIDLLITNCFTFYNVWMIIVSTGNTYH